MKPKLTIVTASYNRPEMLRECAESIFSQTSPDWEWVLVLDGADEATCLVASDINDEWFVRFGACGNRPFSQTWLTILERTTTEEERKSRYMPAVHTNEQFSAARGERVVWLSDDDLLMPRFVEVMTGLRCKMCQGIGTLGIDNYVSPGDDDADRLSVKIPCYACLGTGIPPAVYCSVERRAKTAKGWQIYCINWAVEPWQYGISDGGAMVLSKKAWDELGWREPTGWDTAPDLDQRLMKAVNDKHPLRAVQEVLLIHRDTREAAHQSWRENLWHHIDRMEGRA